MSHQPTILRYFKRQPTRKVVQYVAQFSFPASPVHVNSDRMVSTAAYRGDENREQRLRQKQVRALVKELQLSIPASPRAQNKQQQQQHAQKPSDGYLFNVSVAGLIVTLISLFAILVVGFSWKKWQLEYDGELSISEFCAKDNERYCILLGASVLYSMVLIMKITNVSKILHKRGFPVCIVVLAWFLQIAGLVGFLMLGVFRTNKREEAPSLDATLHKLGASMFVMCSNLGMMLQSNSIVTRSINRMACAVISLCMVSILAAVMFGCTIANNGQALVTLEIFSVVLIIVCYNLCSWTIPPIAEDGTLGDAELNGVCGRGRVVCAG